LDDCYLPSNRCAFCNEHQSGTKGGSRAPRAQSPKVNNLTKKIQAGKGTIRQQLQSESFLNARKS
jgi:hypothetical protein